MDAFRPLHFYVGASFDRKAETKTVQRKILERGHIITGDWTLHRNISPYSQHEETATEYALEDANATLLANVLILLSSEGGTGNHAELGIGVGSYILTGSPLVYVLGDRISKQVFYYTPGVRRRPVVNTLEETTDRIIDEVEHELYKPK